MSLKRDTVSARNITLLIDNCVNYYCGLLFNIKYLFMNECFFIIHYIIYHLISSKPEPAPEDWVLRLADLVRPLCPPLTAETKGCAIFSRDKRLVAAELKTPSSSSDSCSRQPKRPRSLLKKLEWRYFNLKFLL